MNRPWLAPPVDSIKRSAVRFTVAPALAGYEVTDFDGRPVAHDVSEDGALSIAAELNAANFAGVWELSDALGSL